MDRDKRPQDVPESEGGTKRSKAPLLVWIVLALLAAWIIMIFANDPPTWLSGRLP